MMALTAAGQVSGGSFATSMHSRGGGVTTINNEDGTTCMMLQGGTEAAVRA